MSKDTTITNVNGSALNLPLKTDDPQTVFTSKMRWFSDEIRNDPVVLALASAGRYDLAYGVAESQHKAANGGTPPPEPRNPRIAWAMVGETYNAHKSALEALNIPADSVVYDHAMHAVMTHAKASTVKQDNEFIKSLVTDGVDAQKAKSAMATARTTASAYAKAAYTADTIAPHMTDEALAALVSAEEARKAFQEATASAERAYLSNLTTLAPHVRAMAHALKSDSTTLLRKAMTTIDTETGLPVYIPQSGADLNGLYGAKYVMAYRSRKGGMYVFKNVLAMINAIIRDHGVTLPAGKWLFGGVNGTFTTESGLSLNGPIAQDGFSCFSENGGLKIVSGLYQGGSIEQAMIEGNGMARLAFALDTAQEIADLLNPIFAQAEIALYARNGAKLAHVGNGDLITLIKSMVE